LNAILADVATSLEVGRAELTTQLVEREKAARRLRRCPR
jgi:hypothetical protein